MPSTLRKSLHMCFTKIVCDSPSPAPVDNPDYDHQSRPSIFMIKNFNSLYDDYNSTSNSKPLSPTRTRSSSSTLSCEPEPDFATVVASQRFFFTSPGRSNSIVESTPSVAPTPECSDKTNSSQRPSNKYSFSCAKESIAVPTDSPDPYMDFRLSMQEMVEARDLADVEANWDYLHELLLCYLALNTKATHKFIISAFADLLVSLMSPQGT